LTLLLNLLTCYSFSRRDKISRHWQEVQLSLTNCAMLAQALRGFTMSAGASVRSFCRCSAQRVVITLTDVRRVTLAAVHVDDVSSPADNGQQPGTTQTDHPRRSAQRRLIVCSVVTGPLYARLLSTVLGVVTHTATSTINSRSSPRYTTVTVWPQENPIRYHSAVPLADV